MPDSSDSAPKGRRRSFWILIGFGAALAIALPLWVRSVVLDRAVANALWTLSEISHALPKSRPVGDEDDFSPLFPLWPGDVEGGPLASPPPSPAPVAPRSKAVHAKKNAPYRPIVGPRPSSVRANTSLVLSWVESRLVPTGVTRPPYEKIPAGIELKGVSGLGIGLMDGDRLVQVAGAPVDNRGLVVGAVLAARSRQAPTIVATLVRMTKEGPVTFNVTVEQPYLEPDSSPKPDKAPEGAEADILEGASLGAD